MGDRSAAKTKASPTVCTGGIAVVKVISVVSAAQSITPTAPMTLGTRRVEHPGARWLNEDMSRLPSMLARIGRTAAAIRKDQDATAMMRSV